VMDLIWVCMDGWKSCTALNPSKVLVRKQSSHRLSRKVTGKLY
jgi:hypothetical protein